MQVIFNDNEWASITARAGKITEAKDGLDSTIDARPDYQIIGQVGEEAFKFYLEHKRLEYEAADDIIERNYSDRYDFKVMSKDGKWLKIDVKSTVKFDTIVLNERQYNLTIEKKIDILVLCLVDLKNKSCNVVGYGLPADLIRAEHKDFKFKGQIKKMYEG